MRAYGISIYLYVLLRGPASPPEGGGGGCVKNRCADQYFIDSYIPQNPAKTLQIRHKLTKNEHFLTKKMV